MQCRLLLPGVCQTAAIALLLVGAGCTKSPPPAVPPPPVATFVVSPRNVPEEISVSGSIEAIEKTQLGFMVGGRVRSIDVTDGDTVAAGALIARLDDTDYRNELAIAEARLDETRAREVRLRKMHELGSLTAADLDKIISALAQARSAADLARQRVAYTELHAPFAGRVTRHPVTAGTILAPGMPVCSLLAPAPVWATLSVPEADAVRVHPGQPSRVRLASQEQIEVTAPVESILPQADAVTRSFSVKIRLANADLAFRPGNVVTATITVGDIRPVLTVPPTAIQHFPDGALYLWIVDPQRQIVTRRIVGVGQTRGTEVEVTAGINAGDRIVTGVATPLFDGMRVNISHP